MADDSTSGTLDTAAPGRLMPAVVIPSLGGPLLDRCVAAVTSLDPAPERIVVVLSAGGKEPNDAGRVDLMRFDRRLGFAEAVNAGISRCADTADEIAVLNDDATPEPHWLVTLCKALQHDSRLAAVQGTVTDPTGVTVDGRGIVFDDTALPVQVDRGHPAEPEPSGRRQLTAVSGTAALLRTSALMDAALPDGSVFDSTFGCYHEDLDLGLRLCRLGWTACWVPGAPVRHRGSATGRALGWRHPWWVLRNRWKAVAGNLAPRAFAHLLPVMLRGEARAVRTLARTNLRSLPAAAAVLAALPWVITNSLRRTSPGERLGELPEIGS